MQMHHFAGSDSERPKAGPDGAEYGDVFRNPVYG